MNNFKKGFTLLELLIVILIIGILAGIALPQYRKAVYKARFAHYQTMATNIADAVKRITLSKYTDWGYTFEELDIDLPGLQSTSHIDQGWAHGESATFDWGYCYMFKPLPEQADNDVFCGGYDLFGYVQTIQLGTGELALQGYCVTSKDNERGKKFCEAYGPLTNYGCILLPDASYTCGAKQSAVNF